MHYSSASSREGLEHWRRVQVLLGEIGRRQHGYVRVTGIAYGTGRNKRVKITCSQDVFNTDTNVAVTVPDKLDGPSAPPTAVPEQLATEAPYYELVQTLGQSDTDNKLLTHPEIGYVIGAAGSPYVRNQRANLYRQRRRIL